MLSPRLLGPFLVLSASLALAACGGGGNSETDAFDPVPNELITEEDDAGADPAGTDDYEGSDDGTEFDSGPDEDIGGGGNNDGVNDGTNDGADNGTDIGTDDGANRDDSELINNPPEISGTPATEVTENSQYEFGSSRKRMHGFRQW